MVCFFIFVKYWPFLQDQEFSGVSDQLLFIYVVFWVFFSVFPSLTVVKEHLATCCLEVILLEVLGDLEQYCLLGSLLINPELVLFLKFCIE